MPKTGVKIINPTAALAVAIHNLQQAIQHLGRETGVDVTMHTRMADALTSKVLDGIGVKDIVDVSNAGFEPNSGGTETADAVIAMTRLGLIDTEQDGRNG